MIRQLVPNHQPINDSMGIGVGLFDLNALDFFALIRILTEKMPAEQIFCYPHSRVKLMFLGEGGRKS